MKIPADQVSPYESFGSQKSAAPSKNSQHPPARHGDRNDGDDDSANEKFLPASLVKARYSVSDMWLWRRLADRSGFPHPITVSGRRFWRLTELVRWERGLADGQRAREKVA